MVEAKGPDEPAPRSSERCYRFRTTLLCAVNPVTVGFTHMLRPSRGHSAGAGSGAATAHARKKVPVLALKVKKPFAATLAAPQSVHLSSSSGGPVASGCCARMSVSARLAAVRGRYSYVS